MDHLSADFRRNGASPTKHCWCQKTRVIALSCGIKISAMHCSVLSQSTRVTDRRTDGQTDRQNYHVDSRAVKSSQRVREISLIVGYERHMVGMICEVSFA